MSDFDAEDFAPPACKACGDPECDCGLEPGEPLRHRFAPGQTIEVVRRNSVDPRRPAVTWIGSAPDRPQCSVCAEKGQERNASIREHEVPYCASHYAERQQAARANAGAK